MSFLSIVIAVLIFSLLFFLALIIIGSKKEKQPPTKVPFYKKIKINWTIIGIAFLIILILFIAYYGNEGIKEVRKDIEESNAFRVENSIGVNIIEQGKDFIILKGTRDGGTVTLVSEKISPWLTFNYSGENSTFRVSFNGVYSKDDRHGSVFSFSDGIGKFSDGYKKEVNTKVKVEIAIQKNGIVKIENYTIRRN